MAPEFSASDFPGSAGYMQGGMYDENGEEQPMGPCLKSMASATRIKRWQRRQRYFGLNKRLNLFYLFFPKQG